MAKFGPAGNGDTFFQYHRSSVEAPQWLSGLGLDLMEYQCGRGIRIGQPTAEEIGRQAQVFQIAMSVHAPYFINLSSDEEERRRKNVNYITSSCQVAHWLGGNRVVVHCGGLSGRPRDEALHNTVEGLKRALEVMESQGYGDVKLCVETMGRQNVMGTLEEVAFICKSDERLLPCIDFGHLNARDQGCLHTEADYYERLSYLIDQLGYERMRRFHAHFSHIEYGRGGEVRHLTFADTEYGPFFEPCAQALVRLDLHPRVVCESAGTQAEDAVTMKQIYHGALRAADAGGDRI